MPFFNNKYRTESNRLQNWNYSSKGIYFLTICSSNRETIFGSIKDSKINLSQKGKIVLEEIQKSIRIRENWVFHAWVIMPNHIHLLIEIKNEFPKWNFSTIKILDDTVDIECRKLFLNSAETHCSASLPQDDSENIHFKESVETHCSASLPINFKRTPKSISSFVAQFKSKTTKAIDDYDKCSVGSVWQNNYYDRIIWSEEEFKSVYYYIKNNPKNWDTDDLNKL